MATLVSGGTGFVASNVVKNLLQNGHEVISLDIAPPDQMVQTYLQPWMDRVTWICGNICDKNMVQQLGTDYNITKIVHAAVYTSMGMNGWDDVEQSHTQEIIDININGTINLLDLAQRLPLKRFVYVSSGGIYEGAGCNAESIRETATLNPKSLYGITKLVCELLTRRYGELHQFSTVSVRLAGPYGPMERATGYRTIMSMVHEWTHKAIQKRPINIVPRGTMDYTYVLDTAAAICTILDADTLRHNIYNISSGRLSTVSDLVEAIRAIYPSVEFSDTLALEPISPHRDGGQEGLGGYGRPSLDQSRLFEDTGFVCQYDLTSGLQDYFTWCQNLEYYQSELSK